MMAMTTRHTTTLEGNTDKIDRDDTISPISTISNISDIYDSANCSNDSDNNNNNITNNITNNSLNNNLNSAKENTFILHHSNNPQTPTVNMTNCNHNYGQKVKEGLSPTRSAESGPSQAPDRFRGLKLWRDVEKTVVNSPTKRMFIGTRLHKKCVRGNEVVDTVLELLHLQPEQRFQRAKRDNVEKLCNKLVEDGVLVCVKNASKNVPFVGLAAFQDSSKAIYHISPVKLDDALLVTSSHPSTKKNFSRNKGKGKKKKRRAKGRKDSSFVEGEEDVDEKHGDSEEDVMKGFVSTHSLASKQANKWRARRFSNGIFSAFSSSSNIITPSKSRTQPVSTDTRKCYFSTPSFSFHPFRHPRSRSRRKGGTRSGGSSTHSQLSSAHSHSRLSSAHSRLSSSSRLSSCPQTIERMTSARRLAKLNAHLQLSSHREPHLLLSQPSGYESMENVLSQPLVSKSSPTNSSKLLYSSSSSLHQEEEEEEYIFPMDRKNLQDNSALFPREIVSVCRKETKVEKQLTKYLTKKFVLQKYATSRNITVGILLKDASFSQGMITNARCSEKRNRNGLYGPFFPNIVEGWVLAITTHIEQLHEEEDCTTCPTTTYGEIVRKYTDACTRVLLVYLSRVSHPLLPPCLQHFIVECGQSFQHHHRSEMIHSMNCLFSLLPQGHALLLKHMCCHLNKVCKTVDKRSIAASKFLLPMTHRIPRRLKGVYKACVEAMINHPEYLKVNNDIAEKVSQEKKKFDYSFVISSKWPKKSPSSSDHVSDAVHGYILKLSEIPYFTTV
eukprot:m.75621 g.75621  ORF g.75621 m.75621 type:complete len:782 (+) comp8488_c0_seq1:221-2566(+)